jgi:hypothetical protein
MDRRVFIVGGVAALTAPVRVEGQAQTSRDERFFTIEWQLERTGGRDVTIVGSLGNRYRYPLQWARLQAQIVDGAEQITHEAFAMVHDVPAGGRVSFRLPLPAAGIRYVVLVHAFQFGSLESP